VIRARGGSGGQRPGPRLTDRGASIPPLTGGGRRRMLVRVFAATCAEAAAAATGAFATRALFGALHGTTALPAWALVALAASGVGIAAARVAARVAGERLGQSYALAIRRALFDHGTRVSASAVAARRQGYVALRFVGDMTAFRNWAGLGLPRLMAAGVLIPAALAVLALLHAPFLLVVAPIHAAALAAIGLGGLGLPARQRRLRARRAALAADMAERMPVAPELGALGRRRAEGRRMARRAERMIAAAISRQRWSEALRAVPDIAAGLAAVAIIVIGGRTDAGAATVAAGLAALGLSLSPMRDLAGVWAQVSAFRVAHAKVAALLARPARRDAGAGRALPVGPIRVSLKGLTSGPLRSLDAEVPAGARVRLTGANGAGKSRLLALLAGLETAEAGALHLSGVPVGEVSQGSLRRRVARIADDPVILRGSLRRALTLGLEPRPDDARVLATVARCGLGACLARCGGLDGGISEGGRMLSAGERVKIALARAMLRRPRLILLDDATTRLDPAGRAALLAWLEASDATVIAADAGVTPLPGCSALLELPGGG